MVILFCFLHKSKERGESKNYCCRVFRKVTFQEFFVLHVIFLKLSSWIFERTTEKGRIYSVILGLP